MPRRVVGGLIQAATKEIFNGPCFCPSQDAHWYDMAEPVAGPTTNDRRPDSYGPMAEQLP